MAYSTATDIQSEFKGTTFSATSAITSTEVAEFITQTDAMIDAKISNRYTTPVTSTEALKVLKTISIGFVSKRVANILKVKTGEVSKDQDPKYDDLYSLAKKMLEDIRKGDLVLSGAALSSSKAGVSSFNVDNDVEHTMKKGIDQW